MIAEVKVGVVAPSLEARETLRAQIQGLGLASVAAEADQYCVGLADRVTRRLIDARPDVVVVDMEDAAAALHTLHILHTSLPGAWLFVTSAANDPGLIIDAMRAGAREYLLRPVAPRSLSQAIGRFLAVRERTQKQQTVGQLYCVTAVKGGAGATTVAVNLAATVAENPEVRAAVLDLHAPMGDAAGYLNLSPQYTLSDALGAAARLDGVLLRSFMSTSGGLPVLAGPREPWGEAGATPGALGRVIEVALEDLSHVFADLPASLDRELLRTMVETSNAIVVVLTSELPALWRAQRFLGAIDAMGAGDKVRLVLNRSRRGDDVSDAEIEKTLGHPLFGKLPNNYSAAVRAINSGKPVTHGSGSDLASGFSELALLLTGVKPPDRRRSLFGGLLSFSARPSNA